MNSEQPRLVSSSHLVEEGHEATSEFEFGLIVAWNAFSRWATRCMLAAGGEDMAIMDIVMLHQICHRGRRKKLADICFTLNLADTHAAAYSLKKLVSAKLANGEKVGKEVLYSPTESGEILVKQYREIRGTCLLSGIDTASNKTLEDCALVLRRMSGEYDQAARSATSI